MPQPLHDIDAQLDRAAARRRRVRLVVAGCVVLAVLAVTGLVVLGRAAPRPSAARAGRRQRAVTGVPAGPETTVTGPATTLVVPPATLAVPATTVPATAPAGVPAPAAVGSGYTFPVQPAASAHPSSSHHDYPASDIDAPCGSKVVSPVNGTVQDVSRVDTWKASTDDPAVRGGISFSVVGDDGVRYYGAHLRGISPGVDPGVHVASGQQLGEVGNTGNAAGIPCQLHFGISPPTHADDWTVRRGEIWPQHYLASWKGGGQLAPVDEIQAFVKSYCTVGAAGTSCPQGTDSYKSP